MAELWYGKTEAEIEAYAAKCGFTYEEAKDVIKDDYLIDHGEDPHPLTPEQEKASKEARKLGFRKSSNERKPRTRKEDADKRALIAALQKMLIEEGFAPNEEVEVTNIERQIDFKYNDRRFRIVLSAPRK